MADIFHVVDIHTSTKVVLETVGSVEGIRRWWSTNVEGSDDVGGSVTVCFGDQWKVVFLLSIKKAAESGIGTPYPNETKIGRAD